MQEIYRKCEISQRKCKKSYLILAQYTETANLGILETISRYTRYTEANSQYTVSILGFLLFCGYTQRKTAKGMLSILKYGLLQAQREDI